MNNPKKPFFGTIRKFKGKTYDMNGDWYVELYDMSYYFFGIRLTKFTEERVVRNKKWRRFTEMKIKNKLVVFKSVLLFIFPLILSAQLPVERNINFSGVIIDVDSSEPIINVYYSLNGRLKGVSDSEGRFSIFTGIGDTLSFSHIGFRTRILNVSDSLKQDSYLVGIFMTRDTIRLQEIVIFPRLRNLRQEMTGFKSSGDLQNEIAKQNLNIATYQGLKSSADMTDPETQYDYRSSIIIQDAIERGGIPSDKMVSANIFSGIALIVALLEENRSNLPKPVILPDTREIEWIKNYYLKKTAPVSPGDSTEIRKSIKILN